MNNLTSDMIWAEADGLDVLAPNERRARSEQLYDWATYVGLDGVAWLHKLAAFLGAGELPVTEFNLENWYSKGACGFVGCAIGCGILGGVTPPGLRLFGSIDHDTVDILYDEGGITLTGFDAIDRAYGLVGDISDWLFYPMCYPERLRNDRLYVAQRIEAFAQICDEQGFHGGT